MEINGGCDYQMWFYFMIMHNNDELVLGEVTRSMLIMNGEVVVE